MIMPVPMPMPMLASTGGVSVEVFFKIYLIIFGWTLFGWLIGVIFIEKKLEKDAFDYDSFLVSSCQIALVIESIVFIMLISLALLI